MAGTAPVSGNLSMENLAATLTKQEQLGFEQVTGLAIDSTQPRNLVTTISQAAQLGILSICASGTAHAGTKILSTTAYVSGTKTNIDLYRAP
jgi:hypothetical protein